MSILYFVYLVPCCYKILIGKVFTILQKCWITLLQWFFLGGLPCYVWMGFNACDSNTHAMISSIADAVGKSHFCSYVHPKRRTALLCFYASLMDSLTTQRCFLWINLNLYTRHMYACRFYVYAFFFFSSWEPQHFYYIYFCLHADLLYFLFSSFLCEHASTIICLKFVFIRPSVFE